MKARYLRLLLFLSGETHEDVSGGKFMGNIHMEESHSGRQQELLADGSNRKLKDAGVCQT